MIYYNETKFENISYCITLNKKVKQLFGLSSQAHELGQQNISYK